MENKKKLPSEERIWMKFYPEGAEKVEEQNCTVYEYIWERNKEYLGQLALEIFGKKVTYGQLFNEVDKCARALKVNEVGVNQNVAICMPGIMETVFATLALSKIGGCANMLSNAFIKEQLVSKLNDTNSSILLLFDEFYDEKMAQAIEESNVKKVVIVKLSDMLPFGLKLEKELKDTIEKLNDRKLSIPSNEKFIYWKQFLKMGEVYTGKLEEPWTKDRPLVMVYTSGTTGLSKGIVLTNDGFTSMMRQHELSGMRFERGRRFLSVIPTWFSTGICNSVMLPLSLGVTVIFEPRFDGKCIANDFLTKDISYIIGPTSKYEEAFLTSGILKNADLSSVIYYVSGGEATPSRTETLINDFLYAHRSTMPMQKGWGQCELGSCVTVTNEKFNKPNVTGIPLPWVTVKVVDIKTHQELGYNQRGILKVCTPCAMKEYYNNPIATSEFFEIDERGRKWGDSGDIGYITEEGGIAVEGRSSDYILDEIGQPIYLFDIEKVLFEDDAVALCEVVGIEIENGTRQIPVAHIVLRNDYKGQEKEILKRLENLCQNSFLKRPVAIPKGYKFKDGFQATPGGKRDMEVLRNDRNGYIKLVDDSFCYLCFPFEGKPYIDVKAMNSEMIFNSEEPQKIKFIKKDKQ